MCVRTQAMKGPLKKSQKEKPFVPAAEGGIATDDLLELTARFQYRRRSRYLRGEDVG